MLCFDVYTTRFIDVCGDVHRVKRSIRITPLRRREGVRKLAPWVGIRFIDGVVIAGDAV